MGGEGIARRTFLGAAGLAALGGRAAGAPASERLRIGWIGCGGRGRQLLRIFEAFPDVDIPVICDVNAPRMALALEVLAAAPRGLCPERVSDHRRILERRDIDAVVIATCEHWHGLPFIEACRAGKHIFVEKPLSHTVREGRAMVEAAKRAGTIVLMGTQQRAGEHYRRAVDLIRSERLGKILHVECWNYHHVGNRGGRPPDAPVPAGLDWDRWLGPAPFVPFNPLRLDYSWWFDYGGGMMTNWNVHHVDAILWAMGDAPPRSVSCMGALYAADTASDAPDLIDATWEFPGWVLRYAYSGFSNFHRLAGRPHHHGILFVGTRGSLALDREGYEVYDHAAPRKPVEVVPGSPQDGPWQRYFVDCAKEGREPSPSIEQSHLATVICLLGNIAYRAGRRIRWDASTETIPGDPEAAAMLERPRRKGYELPAA